MEIYDDKKNQLGMKLIFMLGQVMVLAVVYLFIYSSFIVVKLAIEKNGVSSMMYFPVFMASIIFPILLYRYRQLFNKGKMIIAFSWMMGTASLTIVLLYIYILQFSN